MTRSWDEARMPSRHVTEGPGRVLENTAVVVGATGGSTNAGPHNPRLEGAAAESHRYADI